MVGMNVDENSDSDVNRNDAVRNTRNEKGNDCIADEDTSDSDDEDTSDLDDEERNQRFG